MDESGDVRSPTAADGGSEAGPTPPRTGSDVDGAGGGDDAVTGSARVRLGTTRVRSAGPRYRGVAAVVAVGLSCAMAVRAARAGSPATMPWVVGGAAASIVLVPSLCGWLARRVGAAVHARGWWTGTPAGVVAGRQIDSAVRQVARLASRNALLILLVAPTTGWLGRAAAGSRWPGWFGVLGVTILLTASWLAALDEVRRSARAVALIGALTARPGLVRSVVAIRVGTSVVIACVVGGVGGLLLSQPLVALGAGVAQPYATIGVLGAVSVAVGVGAWALVVRAGVRAARAWRPGPPEGDDR